jgi:hypothetical protein
VTGCPAGNLLKNGSEFLVDENWMRVLKYRLTECRR